MSWRPGMPGSGCLAGGVKEATAQHDGARRVAAGYAAAEGPGVEPETADAVPDEADDKQGHDQRTAG